MIIPTINSIRENPIQIGDKTHTQLQLITLVSFRTMNATVKSPVNPIPPDADVDDFSDIVFDFYSY